MSCKVYLHRGFLRKAKFSWSRDLTSSASLRSTAAVIGAGSSWSTCNATSCGKGVELRYFQPRQLAAFGGEACPASPESNPCRDNSGCTSNVSLEEPHVRSPSSSSLTWCFCRCWKRPTAAGIQPQPTAVTMAGL